MLSNKIVFKCLNWKKIIVQSFTIKMVYVGQARELFVCVIEGATGTQCIEETAID